MWFPLVSVILFLVQRVHGQCPEQCLCMSQIQVKFLSASTIQQQQSLFPYAVSIYYTRGHCITQTKQTLSWVSTTTTYLLYKCRYVDTQGPFTNDVTSILRFLTPPSPLVTLFTIQAYKVMSPFGDPLPPSPGGDVICVRPLMRPAID